jgi:Polysaccharide lyase
MSQRQRSRRRLAFVGFLLAVAALLAATIALAGGLGSNATDSSYVSASTLSRPKTPGRTLFNSTFASNDFSEWHLQSLPGRARIVHGDAYEGSTDARFEVREGDVEPETGSNRSEVSGPDFSEGDDLYVRDAIRVPPEDTFRGPWQIIQQLHENDWGGSPGIAVFLTSSRRLNLGAGDGNPTFWEGPRLRKDRWYDLVYRVKLSQDPQVGSVEVWLNGRRQRLTNGHHLAHGQTIQTDSTYLKLGIYRSEDSHGTSVVEHDGVFVIARGH